MKRRRYWYIVESTSSAFGLGHARRFACVLGGERVALALARRLNHEEPWLGLYYWSDFVRERSDL